MRDVGQYDGQPPLTNFLDANQECMFLWCADSKNIETLLFSRMKRRFKGAILTYGKL